MTFLRPMVASCDTRGARVEETERGRAGRDGIVRARLVWSVCVIDDSRACGPTVRLGAIQRLLQALAHDDGHRSLARGFAANEERNVVLAEIYDRAVEHERARGEIEGFLTSNLERDEGAAGESSRGQKSNKRRASAVLDGRRRRCRRRVRIMSPHGL